MLHFRMQNLERVGYVINWCLYFLFHDYFSSVNHYLDYMVMKHSFCLIFET